MSTVGNDQLAERPYGWVIVGVATICLTLGFGTNSTISVFMKPFEQEFGWSRADISMAFTLLTVGCAIGGVSVGQVMKTIWPFYGALIFALMLVTYVPAFSLWLPNLLLK